jgi:hypothetical protein
VLVDLKKVQREVMLLADQCYEFIIDAESHDGRFQFELMELYELGVELETWYASSTQIMATTGFRGIGRFERLCEDESFSMPRYVRGLFPDEDAADDPEFGKFVERLWQMHFILKSLPVALAAGSKDEVHGIGARDIVEYLHDAVGRVDVDYIREVGPGIRTHIEEAVNLAMAHYGVVVERKPDRKHACFQDKLEALKTAGRINGSELERLANAYRSFSRTAHTAQPESGEALKAILSNVLEVVSRKLLTAEKA